MVRGSLDDGPMVATIFVRATIPTCMADLVSARPVKRIWLCRQLSWRTRFALPWQHQGHLIGYIQAHFDFVIIQLQSRYLHFIIRVKCVFQPFLDRRA